MKRSSATLLRIDEDGREVWCDAHPGCSDSWIARRWSGPEARASIVCLDDEVSMGSVLARIFRHQSAGTIRVYHCARSKAFRACITHLRRLNEPVVAVTSDLVHTDESGLMDLRFVAQAPPDFAFAALQARALPRLMMSGSGSELMKLARDEGAHTFDKPFRIPDLVSCFFMSLKALRDDVSMDLRSEADFIQGTAGWGPRAEVEAARDRLDILLGAMRWE